MDNWTWTCIVCGKEMKPSFQAAIPTPDTPPSRGLIFTSSGNYGSSFDPIGLPERVLKIAVCDKCVSRHQKHVVYSLVRPQAPMTTNMRYREGMKHEREFDRR